MDGYWQIYLLISLLAMLSGIICKRKSKDTVRESLLFAVVYYYFLAVYRIFQGHGTELLGQAYQDKNVVSYLKITIFVFAVGIVFWNLRRVKILDQIAQRTIMCGMVIHLLSVVILNFVTIRFVMYEGFAALLLAVVTIIVEKKTGTDLLGESADNHGVDKNLMVHLTGWVCFYLITGPSEIVINNQKEIMISYGHIIVVLVIGGIAFLVSTYLISKYVLDKKITRIMAVIVFAFLVLSYIQTMLLNGTMNILDGVEQQWGNLKIYINLCVWIIGFLIIVLAAIRTSKAENIYRYISEAIIALQMLALVSLVFTNDISMKDKTHLTYEDRFALSEEQNIIVFILDTFDSQMINYIVERDENYLEPMHDFTYFNNMESRFGFTDGSLPYLLTGTLDRDEENGLYEAEIYENSTFMKDIKDYGFDTRMITASQYAENFGDALIDNLESEANIAFDAGKCTALMAKCSRYKGAPFIIKNHYKYSGFDFDDLVTDGNVVLFGQDEEFYNSLINTGITKGKYDKCFRLYHLYGAHSPYYFRESMTYDYSKEEPLQQWRASLAIVYEFISQLKANDLYDNTTIIVMADHGPNIKQRKLLAQLGIDFSDELRPIFFIKKIEEKHDTMIIDNKATSHDVFQATVLYEIDKNDNRFGEPVW